MFFVIFAEGYFIFIFVRVTGLVLGVPSKFAKENQLNAQQKVKYV